MRIYKSSAFHKAVTFLIFVVIAAVFWYILALNDNIQDNIEVQVHIDNVPDSVTFINVPPEKIHVMVRDKGTNLLRNGVLSDAVMAFNFRDFSEDGVFRVSRSELNGALKNTFGGSAAIISCSIDSLRCAYTTLPGKRLPVEVAASITPASGKVIRSVTLSPSNVTVYSTRDVLDTITRVFTERFVRRGLEESTSFNVELHNVRGVRIQPGYVKVDVDVEPLVKKESNVAVKVENAPANVDLLLFPARVNVEYYTPMSRYSDADPVMDVWVDYRDIDPAKKTLVVHVGHVPRDVINVTVREGEVEYVVSHQ